MQKKQRQAAQLSSSLPASLPAAAPVSIMTPVLSSASESTDDAVTSIDTKPPVAPPPADVVTESPVETTVMVPDTDTQSTDTGHKHEPTLLERMSLAESNSLAAATGTVAAEADGVAVTSRQRKSKGRKKKRRPKDTLVEEGRHSRRGIEQQHVPSQEKEEEGPLPSTTRTQSTTVEQHDTVTHSNQETPEIPAVGEGSEADMLTDPIVATGNIEPDAMPVQPESVEKEIVEEPVIRPQLDSTNPFDSNGVNEEEEKTIGHSSHDSNQPEDPSRTPFITDEPDNDEINDDFRDLEAAGAMAVAARRASRQRGRSDAISSPVRSSHDYCMVDDSSPGEIERASDSPLVTGELTEF